MIEQSASLERGIRKPRVPPAVGFAALFGGVALVAHIVAGLSLRTMLLFTSSIVALSLRLMWRRAAADDRQRLARVFAIGAGVGLLATVANDAAKYALSVWDPSPYNPFEAIRIFGVLLAGPTAGTTLTYGLGAAFHAVNGTSFGMAYTFFFGHRGAIAGVAWGLFLETFQLTLYPGWLDIRAYREFAQISALSHVVYGLVLGLLARRLLRRVA
jgi:hypothetical protein